MLEPLGRGGRDARLDAELLEIRGGRTHLLDAPRSVGAAAGQQPSEQRLAEDLRDLAVERSSAPAAFAASRLSIAAAAMPFMKTLRRSFSPAASPGCRPTTSTGIPSGRNSSAKRSAPAPETSAGVARPVLGHDAVQRDVGERHRQRVRELALQLRRRGVQVGVDRVAAEARRRRGPPR